MWCASLLVFTYMPVTCMGVCSSQALSRCSQSGRLPRFSASYVDGAQLRVQSWVWLELHHLHHLHHPFPEVVYPSKSHFAAPVRKDQQIGRAVKLYTSFSEIFQNLEPLPLPVLKSPLSSHSFKLLSFKPVLI